RKHFSEQGIDISHLLDSTGRKYRYVSEDIYENSLTMAVQASQKVLESTNIDPKEIGLLVFVSTTPEYLCPTNALKIHRILNLNKKAAAYDMNANCCGMLIAMNQICKVMKFDTSIKYSLIIGSDQLFRYADKTDPFAYSNYGESACAVLLENLDDSPSDFKDSSSSVDTSVIDFTKFPSGGFSEFISSNNYIDKNKMILKSRDLSKTHFLQGSQDSIDAVHLINNLILRNNLKKADIKLYCLSQVSKKAIDRIRESLEESEEKFPFIGDEYGYTGVTSPFIALADSITKNKIKRGDYVILWTIGAGIITSATLIRY
ncbi:MAG: 3-oxoacyl-[acyl-carrier-protein] synthase III C-terminal domain-containing protein, partial [Clostridium sp.]